MDSNIGWLLDVSIQQNHATIWIKTTDGKILRLTDTYEPNFYVLPKNESAGVELFHSLSQEPKITKVEWQNKLTDLFDYDKHGMKKLICIYPEPLLHYKTIVNRLEKDPKVAQLFNTELSHVYLFTNLSFNLSFTHSFSGKIYEFGIN